MFSAKNQKIDLAILIKKKIPKNPFHEKNNKFLISGCCH